MKNTFFMIMSSFLPLALLSLFADRNTASAQPQQGQPQGGQPQTGQSQRRASQTVNLEAYSLPAGTIAENDMDKIKNTIQQVLAKISEPMKSAGKKADYQTLKSGILTFQDWLKKQGCLSNVSTTYDIETTDKYSDSIFVTHPGQLPFDMTFNMGGDIKKAYRLLMFVSTADFLRLASLAENKSIAGVPAIKSWPKDVMSYWENKL
jgi:hypothetical protein